MIEPHEALHRADMAHAKIDAHEDVCAERYAHIQTSISGVQQQVKNVTSILITGGSLLLGVILTVIGYLAVRAIEENDRQIHTNNTQIEELRSQVR